MTSKRFNLFLIVSVSLALSGLIGCSKPEPSGDAVSAALSREMQEAEALIHQGRYDQALSRLTGVLAKSPKDPQIHLNMGWVYLYTEQPDKAKKELESVYELDPDSAKAAYLQAAILKDAHQYKEALAWYLKAESAEKDNPQYHYDLALLYNRMNRQQEALKVLNKALSLVGSNKERKSQLLYTLCDTHYQLKQFKQAIESCSQVIKTIDDPLQRQQVIDFTENIKLMQLLEKKA